MSVRTTARVLLALLILPFSIATVDAASSVGDSGCWEGSLSDCFGEGGSGIPRPTGAVSVGDGVIQSGVKAKITAIANRIIALTAVVAMGGIVFAGFHMVTAFGDDEKHKKGKEALKWAVMGFGLALLSFPLVNATINFFYASGG